jgi:hypothetical protein
MKVMKEGGFRPGDWVRREIIGGRSWGCDAEALTSSLMRGSNLSGSAAGSSCRWETPVAC